VATARTGISWRARFGAAFLALSAPLLGLSACALGPEEEPGCQSDEACGEGYLCRAGACFRATTGLTPPEDPADAGDGGEEGGGDEGDGG
jgi:hypothetical protein